MNMPCKDDEFKKPVREGLTYCLHPNARAFTCEGHCAMGICPADKDDVDIKEDPVEIEPEQPNGVPTPSTRKEIVPHGVVKDEG